MSDLAALYRVSTPQQLKNDDEMPIPAQQAAAHNFCSVYDHNLVKEYFEPGVSAFRKSLFDRNIIKEVISDAQKGLFSILLIFKNSRLSRRSDEYPWLINELKKHDVIVWEIDRNKRLTPLSHEEKLTTFIDGWQAEGESINISKQSRAGKIAKAYQGGKTGGPASYGFEVVDWAIEIVGKRPKTKAIWGINEREASLVIQMVEMYENGHGSGYIAKYFNTHDLLNRSGGEWTSTNVRRVLRNPALAGISLYRNDNKITKRVHRYQDLYDPAYYVHKDKEGNYIINEELKILPLDRWLNLMNIMDNRPTGGYINPNRTQTQLLSGFVRCGYCGRSMTGVASFQEYKKKDGTISVYDKSGYRCNSHGTGRTCPGPYHVSLKKINEPFYYDLDDFITRFDAMQFINDTEEISHQGTVKLKKDLNNAQRLLKRTEGIKNKWLNEMDEYFARNGEYIFSKENIAAKITEQEFKIRDLQRDISEITQRIDSHTAKNSNVKKLAEVIPNWYEHFKTQSVEVQNMMLSDVLNEVVVYRDRIEVNYRINIRAIAEETTSTYEFIDLNKVVNFCE